MRVLKFSETYQAQFEDTRLLRGVAGGERLAGESRMARAELDDGQIFTLRGFRLVESLEATRAEG